MDDHMERIFQNKIRKTWNLFYRAFVLEIQAVHVPGHCYEGGNDAIVAVRALNNLFEI